MLWHCWWDDRKAIWLVKSPTSTVPDQSDLEQLWKSRLVKHKSQVLVLLYWNTHPLCNNGNKGQSHFGTRQGSIAMNIIWLTGSRMGLVMVLLDRALPSSCRLSRVTVLLSVRVSIQNLDFDWGFRSPNLPIPVGGLRPLSNMMLLGTTQVSLPNGISFHPAALAECTSMTDGQPDRRTYHAW